MNMKWNPKVVLPIAVFAFGVLGAVVLIKARPVVSTRVPEVPPPLVRAETVRLQGLRMKVTAQGNVTPRTESNLVSQVAGQVVSVSPAFASGGFFEAGETLVEIDPRDYNLALARARSQVAQAELHLAQEKEESAVARQEWERIGKGSAGSLVLREPQLAEAEAGLEAARAGVELAKLNLERTRISGPYAGRIRTKHVDVGQFVNPGSPVARIYSVDFAEVRLPVPDKQLAFLDHAFGFRGELAGVQGPEVLLAAEFAGQRHAWSGRIVRVEGEIDPRTRMVYLVARVENPYARGEDPNRPPLAAGLFVEAEIMGRRFEGVAVLPRTAVRGENRVLVIDDQDRLRFREIEILRADAGVVVVRSGLDEGERICLSPLDAVTDGMRVRIMVEEETLTGAGGSG